MFSFDFGTQPSDNGSPDQGVEGVACSAPSILVAYGNMSSFRSMYDSIIAPLGLLYEKVLLPVSGTHVGVVDLNNAQLTPEQAAQLNALTEHKTRDIVPGQYLGGLKIWSCAIDLADYLACEPALPFPTVQQLSMLEVGAGHAIPSIAAMRRGGAQIKRFIVQDYNTEVLQFAAIPNIAAYLAASTEPLPDTVVEILASSWRAMCADIRLRDIHVILGGDVTYDSNAIADFLALLERALSSDGVALVATKQYYFGTRGGLVELQEQIARQYGTSLRVDVLRTIEPPNELWRAIVCIRRVNHQ